MGNICNRLSHAYAPTCKVQTSLILCRKDCSLRYGMSAKFPRGGRVWPSGRQSIRTVKQMLLPFFLRWGTRTFFLVCLHFQLSGSKPIVPNTFIVCKMKYEPGHNKACLSQMKTKEWISLHTCAVWSGPLMSATQIVAITLIPIYWLFGGISQKTGFLMGWLTLFKYSAQYVRIRIKLNL